MQQDANAVVETTMVVVGAGPAGLQLAHLLQVKGYSYVVLEKEEKSAAFQARYPVHGRLISLNKRFVGSDNQELKYRQDWNSLISVDGDPMLFTSYTDKMYPDRNVLRQYMLDWQERKALNVLNSVAVKHVRRMPDGKFEVTASNDKTYVCTYLFMATGAVGPYAPRSIEGIEMTDGYEDQTSNFENRDYRDKRVLIIGKGNSAFETADFLSSQAAVIHLVSRHHVKQAWDTHFVGHLRSVNNNVLDMYQLKAQVGILNAHVESIKRIDGGRFGTKFSVSFRFTDTPDDPYNVIEYDAIIRATGWRYIKPDMFCDETCKVATTDSAMMDGRFPELNSNFESTSVPNLFWIGANSQGRRFKQDTSGFIHGFRYLVQVTLKILEWRELGKTLSTTDRLVISEESICDKFLNRLNTSSALFQMQSTLCDVCTFAHGDTQAEYFEEIPLSFVMERLHARVAPFDTQVVIIGILKYGNRGDVDAFRYKLQATPARPELSVFLHPYFETYLHGKLVRSIHLLENLENEFKDEACHLSPVRHHIALAMDANAPVQDVKRVPSMGFEASNIQRYMERVVALVTGRLGSLPKQTAPKAVRV